MITLDTSGLIASMSLQDPYHGACVAVLGADPGPYIIPAGILAEVTWMLESMFPPAIEQAFFGDLRDTSYALHWDAQDIERIQTLTQRYHDLPLGFSDAAVIACAEQHGGRVLTLDHRHFSVVARGEKSLVLLPE